MASPTKSLTNENPNLVAEKHYRYVKNDLALDIEMRYMPETDIRELVEVEFTKLSKSVETIQPLLELINLWRLLGYR